MTYPDTDSTNIIIGRRPNYAAENSVRQYHKATFEELIEEKNPGISFDLLPPEAKEKAKEKLKAFDEIVKPKADQKQEHDTKFKSEDQEFDFWYPNLSGPTVPNSSKPK